MLKISLISNAKILKISHRFFYLVFLLFDCKITVSYIRKKSIYVRHSEFVISSKFTRGCEIAKVLYFHFIAFCKTTNGV